MKDWKLLTLIIYGTEALLLKNMNPGKKGHRKKGAQEKSPFFLCPFFLGLFFLVPLISHFVYPSIWVKQDLWWIIKGISTIIFEVQTSI